MASGKNKSILKFATPAKWWGSSWREALPTGNGIIGCSVLGGAANDSIMITHSDLWWQGKVGVLPEVCASLPAAKKLVAEGKYLEAGSVLPDALIAKGYRPSMSYPLPLCDFNISMNLSHPPKDYYRSINTDTGEVSVSFRDGSTRYTRSVFAPRNQDYIVFEITKAGQKGIDADFSLALHDKFNNRTPGAFTNLPEGAVSKNEGKLMYFSARSDNGMDFGCVAHISYFGGTLTPTDECVSVRGAEKLFVVLKPFVGIKNRDQKQKDIATELKAFKVTYEKLLKEQAARSKTYLELADDDTSVDALLADSTGNISPALVEKLWSYGRYLFTSSTTPSSAPVAPYGIFCGDFKAVDSNLCADGTLQLCYEHTLSGGLTEYLDALFAHYENVIDELKKNAIRLFDCRGVMIPSIVARGTGLLGATTPEAIYFTGAAGWLCKLMYDAYLFSADQKVLKRIMPFLKETAQFYMDFFVLGEDSFFQSIPAFSPGSQPANAPKGTVAIKNPLIDFAIARELLSNLIEGSVELNINKGEIEAYRTFLQRIPPYKTAGDGTVMEYFDNSLQDNAKSGGTSLFYPIYPGTEVLGGLSEVFCGGSSDSASSAGSAGGSGDGLIKSGAESSAAALAAAEAGELLKAFEKTATKRFSFGAHHSAISLARFVGLFVRLRMPDKAEEIMTALVRACGMSNLVFAASDWSGMGIANSDSWARFGIEPNLILVSAIQEMFVQSAKDTIWILPACSFVRGELGGFLTRAGVELTQLVFDRKKGSISLKLKAKKTRKVTLVFADKIKKYKGIGVFDADTNAIKDLELPAGKIISLDLKI